jgi:magnesium transporter
LVSRQTVGLQALAASATLRRLHSDSTRRIWHTIVTMADDSTTGIRGITGTDEAANDAERDLTVPAASICHVVHAEEVVELQLHRDNLERLLASGSFFWIDLPRPSKEDFAVLRDVFQFHPLALEDSEHFGQRAKLEDYDDFVFLVVYGAAPDQDRLVEVHCFYSERFLITVHRDEAPAFAEVRHRYQVRKALVDTPALLLYRIIDSLVDSFFPILADFDDRIDELENETFLHASDKQLQEIFAMKRLLVGIRKAVTPQRDLFAGVLAGVVELPGMTTEAERHFRDIYDHLIRISDLIDTYRDLLSSSMDVFLSTVSNRLNIVMKELAVIATIFLPLTFITGFFGQNFGWLVRNIDGWPAFAVLGLGVEILAIAILMMVFKRRSWF